MGVRAPAGRPGSGAGAVLCGGEAQDALESAGEAAGLGKTALHRHVGNLQAVVEQVASPLHLYGLDVGLGRHARGIL